MAVLAVLGFIILVGLLIGTVVYIFDYSLEPEKYEVRRIPGNPEAYGYAFNSFNYVKAKLPTPPENCAWEHRVYADKSGEVWHSLAVYNLLSEKVTASRKISLTNDRQNGNGMVFWTWAHSASRWPVIHINKCKRNSNILIEFAIKEKHKPQLVSQGEIRYELEG